MIEIVFVIRFLYTLDISINFIL